MITGIILILSSFLIFILSLLLDYEALGSYRLEDKDIKIKMNIAFVGYGVAMVILIVGIALVI